MQYALRTITFFAKYYLRNACISTVEKVKIPKCDYSVGENLLI